MTIPDLDSCCSDAALRGSQADPETLAADRERDPIGSGSREPNAIAWESLRDFLVLKSSEEALLKDLAGVFKRVAFRARTRILAEWDFGDCMYFVVRGRVEVHSRGRTLEVIGEGGVFGEMAVVSGAPRTATVRALSDCDLYRLDLADFRRIRVRYPQFNGALQTLINSRLPALRSLRGESPALRESELPV